MRLPVLVLIFCAGCATTPVLLSKAKPVPSQRLYGFQDNPLQNSALLVIMRDNGGFATMGVGTYHSVSINGHLAACFDVAEIARFYVPPGDVSIKYGLGSTPVGFQTCDEPPGGPDDMYVTRETSMKPNETKYFRLSIDDMGTMDIFRIEPADHKIIPQATYDKIKNQIVAKQK